MNQIPPDDLDPGQQPEQGTVQAQLVRERIQELMQDLEALIVDLDRIIHPQSSDALEKIVSGRSKPPSEGSA